MEKVKAPQSPAYRMQDGDLAPVICPGCGSHVEGYGRGYTGKTFCSTTCRQGFNNRMKAEGAPIAALVKAWTMTRHAKPGTREAEVCRYARSQLTQIAAEFNDRDDEAGRPSAVAYVETLMRAGTLYCDRQRDPKPKPPKPLAEVLGGLTASQPDYDAEDYARNYSLDV